jgi:hypothetical protein
LSALILGGKYAGKALTDAEFAVEAASEEEDPQFGAYDINGHPVQSTIRYGDHGRGKIVSVACS